MVTDRSACLGNIPRELFCHLLQTLLALLLSSMLPLHVSYGEFFRSLCCWRTMVLSPAAWKGSVAGPSCLGHERCIVTPLEDVEILALEQIPLLRAASQRCYCFPPLASGRTLLSRTFS